MNEIENYILLDKLITKLVRLQYDVYEGKSINIGSYLKQCGLDINRLEEFIRNKEKCGKMKLYIEIDDIAYLNEYRKKKGELKHE